MKKYALLFLLSFMVACRPQGDAASMDHDGAAAQTIVKGPHNGRMLVDGPFALELAIFETGVPPEFHAWPTLDGKPVPLDQVDLSVDLTRLGDKHDRFTFAPKGDFLRADRVVHEPHSFVFHVVAKHAGNEHSWTYDSFEGRTTIAREIGEAAGIRTEPAGRATLVQTLTLYGRIVPDPAHERDVSARYPGLIRTVHKRLGDHVSAGDALVDIESNESLKTYSVTAPIAGIVTARNANSGEQSTSGVLFTIMDPGFVWAELSVFPRDRGQVRAGAQVEVKAADSDAVAEGRIERVDVQAAANQAVTARVSLKNTGGTFVSGSFVTAEVAVAQRTVPLAVKSVALQPFRDFMVVYEQVGETYEVRMLELGEQRGEWVEVLGGLEPGATYVTENSYVIKADIEKSGAAHEH
jgi:cobalt-zinc-cadmium efflux system membrane fusion protein